MKTFDIWIEGYSATGESGKAQYKGSYQGITFQDACEQMMKEKGWEMSYYNKDRDTFWGCRFFDNESDARKSFG